MSDINPNCCGDHCIKATAEVRVYPLGGGANLILCFECFAHENEYRWQRGEDTGRPEDWPQVKWFDSKTYPEDAS